MILNVLLLFFVLKSEGTKIWKPSTNMDDPDNWQGHILPKGCARLDLAAAQDIAVQMSSFKDTKIASIKLPQTGYLSLSDGFINFSGSSCKNITDGVYLREVVKGWLDPENWNSLQKGWLPHGNRVPCNGEYIVFPKGKSFTIMLPAVLTPIGRINYQGQNFGQIEWSAYLNSEDGFERFKGDMDRRNVWQTNGGCGNVKTCDLCGQGAYVIRDGEYTSVNQKTLLDAVCVYARRRCETTESVVCYNPVLPENHCCPICGSLIDIIDYASDNQRIKSITQKVEDYFRNKGSPKFYIGRKFDGNIQIVLTGDQFENILSVSKELTNILQGTEKVSLKLSGPDKNTNLSSHIAGAIFGSFLLVVSIFTTIFCVYNYFPNLRMMRKSTQSQFMFARFDNTLKESSSDDNIQVLTAQETLNNTICNPLYKELEASSDVTSEEPKSE